MKRQFLPPPIYLQTANAFLWLTLILYFTALLVMALQPPDFNFLPLYLLISSPFPIIGIWFYLLSRERIMLTDEGIIWLRLGRPIMLRYKEITGFIETGFSPVPALVLFDNQDRRIKISRTTQDYHVLYNLLQDRIPILRQGSPLGFPWILRLQTRYLVLSILGLTSLIILFSGISIAASYANHSQHPLRLVAIAGVPVAILTLIAVVVIGQEFHWTHRIECLSDRIRWVRLWGKTHTFFTRDLVDIRREARQISYRGFTRTEWPLIILFSKGAKLVIAEPMASALGISVDRLAAGLKGYICSTQSSSKTLLPRHSLPTVKIIQKNTSNQFKSRNRINYVRMYSLPKEMPIINPTNMTRLSILIARQSSLIPLLQFRPTTCSSVICFLNCSSLMKLK